VDRVEARVHPLVLQTVEEQAQVHLAKVTMAEHQLLGMLEVAEELAALAEMQLVVVLARAVRDLPQLSPELLHFMVQAVQAVRMQLVALSQLLHQHLLTE
jgi:hypothetical protein